MRCFISTPKPNIFEIHIPNNFEKQQINIVPKFEMIIVKKMFERFTQK